MTKGAINLKGHHGSGPLYFHDGSDWIRQSVPNDSANNNPSGSGETEYCWYVLADCFVRDIRGEIGPPCQTLKEGSHYQEIIDVIRESDLWVDVAVLH